MRALILLSGGIDSAACLAFYRELGHSTEAIFVDYGQPAAIAERTSADAISAYYSTPLHSVTCRSEPLALKGEIPGRNAFLVLGAVLFNPKHSGMIALGIHRGTSYYDCQDLFLDDMSRILSGYSDGRIKLAAPFLSWTKDMIWSYCLQHNVPVDLTWSCEVSSTEACGTCLSCRDLEALRVRSQ